MGKMARPVGWLEKGREVRPMRNRRHAWLFPRAGSYALTQRAEEYILEGLRPRSEMPDLHPVLAGGAEDQLRAQAVGQEDAVAVLPLAPLAALVLQVGEQRRGVSLDPHVVHRAPRTGQIGDRAGRGHLAL